MNTTDPAQRAPTIIEITVSSGLDDGTDSPYRGRSDPTIVLRSTTAFHKRALSYHHLGFSFPWEKFIYQRDGKCCSNIWLPPFTGVYARIVPFALTISNIGDGQIRTCLKLARDMPPYRMVVTQEGKSDREIEAYTFEKDRYAVACVNEMRNVRIEEG